MPFRNLLMVVAIGMAFARSKVDETMPPLRSARRAATLRAGLRAPRSQRTIHRCAIDPRDHAIVVAGLPFD